MRLLLVNKFWYPKGGVETYLFELIQELPAHGYQAIPFAMKHPLNRDSRYTEFFVDQVDYNQRDSWYGNVKKAGRILHSAHASRRLTALLAEVRPDLAHLHNVYHQISPSILPVLKRHRIPMVMTLHDLKLACPNYKMRTHGEICERCVPGKFYNAVLHRCVKGSLLASALCAAELFLHKHTGVYAKNVDRFIVPSRFYLQKMVESGIPEEKLVWIPSFTHVERYTPAYGGLDYCVYLGRLSEEKGLITLLEAMRGLDQRRLLVVGDGPLRPTLESVIDAHRLKNVQLVGSKSGQDLIDLIAGARFSVIPSEWYENCPRSCIESFACGKPVIGANIGGIPEMVEDGQSGLLFRPFSAGDLREKIDYLFEHDELVVQMGKKARARAERDYSAKAHLARLLNVYAQAMRR